jgi:hypothetical protein
MVKVLSIILLLVLILTSCALPVAITDYKEIQCDDTLFMAWTTNVDTHCTIEYCWEGKCYWTGNSEWGKLHTIIMPDYYTLTIHATDKNGATALLGVK